MEVTKKVCGGGLNRVVECILMRLLYIIFNIYNIEKCRFNKEKMDRDCKGRFGFGGKCGNSLLRKKVREKSNLSILNPF